MSKLKNFKVAVLATNGVEQSELTEPVKALKEAGATVHVLSPDGKDIWGFKHMNKTEILRVDRNLNDADPVDYDGLMLPGGAMNADKLRMNLQARNFVQSFYQGNKPIAAICHAPWLLVSSGIIHGRVLTSYHTIQDDIRNAGGHWVDRDVVRDGNLITSRDPDDLPAFNRAMLELFAGIASRPLKELLV